MLPVPWQLLLMEQTVVSIGCTSVENFGVIPTQEKEIPLLFPSETSLLLQAVNNDIAEKITRMTMNVVFMIGILKPVIYN